MNGIIAQFTESAGIIELKNDYDHISSFRIEDLREILSKFKDGVEVRLAFAKHSDGGNMILMKPRESEVSHWLCACPVIGKDSNRYPVPIHREEQ